MACALNFSVCLPVCHTMCAAHCSWTPRPARKFIVTTQIESLVGIEADVLARRVAGDAVKGSERRNQFSNWTVNSYLGVCVYSDGCFCSQARWLVGMSSALHAISQSANNNKSTHDHAVGAGGTEEPRGQPGMVQGNCLTYSSCRSIRDKEISPVGTPRSFLAAVNSLGRAQTSAGIMVEPTTNVPSSCGISVFVFQTDQIQELEPTGTIEFSKYSLPWRKISPPNPRLCDPVWEIMVSPRMFTGAVGS